MVLIQSGTELDGGSIAGLHGIPDVLEITANATRMASEAGRGQNGRRCVSIHAQSINREESSEHLTMHRVSVVVPPYLSLHIKRDRALSIDGQRGIDPAVACLSELEAEPVSNLSLCARNQPDEGFAALFVAVIGCIHSVCCIRPAVDVGADEDIIDLLVVVIQLHCEVLQSLEGGRPRGVFTEEAEGHILGG